MELWSFETIHCLNFNTQRHGVTNYVKVNFLICGFVGCMKNMIFLAYIRFYFLSICAIEFTEKLTLIHVFPKVCLSQCINYFTDFFASHGFILCHLMLISISVLFR